MCKITQDIKIKIVGYKCYCKLTVSVELCKKEHEVVWLISKFTGQMLHASYCQAVNNSTQ